MKKDKAPKTLQDAFIDEVNEDLKNDQLKKIWEQYGLQIIIAVVAILVAAVSFESIKAWRIRHHQDSSNVFAYALNLSDAGKIDESNRVLNQIAEKKGGIYADASKMQIAKNLFREGKIAEAENALSELIANRSTNPQVRNVAIIKLASMKVENVSYAELEKLLSPILENPNWSAIAKSLLALSAIKEKDLKKAEVLYSEVASDGNAPESLKAEAQDMTALLTEKAQ